MGFLDKIANWIAPGTPAAPAATSAATPAATLAGPRAAGPLLSPVPADLPRIAAKTAAEICKGCKPDAAAQQLLTSQQTPAQFLGALQERRMGPDMIKVLAYGLAEREAVGWAVQSVKRVSDKLPPLDAAALQAAALWARSPSAENRIAAENAAKKTDFQGPGAWAAQAAAWSTFGVEPAASDESGQPQPVPGTEQLAAHAVQGAVFLAIAKASDGKDGGFDSQHPFIAIGLGIASGGTPLL